MVGDELAGEAKMLQVSVIRLWNKTSATAMPAGRPFSPGPMQSVMKQGIPEAEKE